MMIAYINLVKGHYYLRKGKTKKALPLLTLAESSSSKYPSLLNEMVSGRIFSNNTKECYSCPEENIMEDSVHNADVFSFIQTSFGKLELSENLLKLDSLTNSPKAWKQKLANYLLANYYFNVSNTGYYRGVLMGLYSDRNRFSYGKSQGRGVKSKLAAKEGYNLFNIGSGKSAYYGLARKARAHYEQVLALSTDPELNARCLYMIAKCELNSYYNNEAPFYSDGGMSGAAANYKEGFRRLEEKYSNTSFYKEIIKECSYFRYYTTL